MTDDDTATADTVQMPTIPPEAIRTGHLELDGVTLPPAHELDVDAYVQRLTERGTLEEELDMAQRMIAALVAHAGGDVILTTAEVVEADWSRVTVWSRGTVTYNDSLTNSTQITYERKPQ